MEANTLSRKLTALFYFMPRSVCLQSLVNSAGRTVKMAKNDIITFQHCSKIAPSYTQLLWNCILDFHLIFPNARDLPPSQSTLNIVYYYLKLTCWRTPHLVPLTYPSFDAKMRCACHPAPGGVLPTKGLDSGL